MSSLNKAMVIGNLGRDPESRTFPSGGRAVSFSVATSERWTDKRSGEKREKTEWHNVSILNEKLCDVAEKYLRRGSKVYLEGQLQTRKWQDSQGEDRYTTEIVLRQFNSQLVLLGGRESAAQDDEKLDDAAPGEGAVARRARTDDDEVPF